MNRRKFLSSISIVPAIAVIPKDLKLILPEVTETTRQVSSPNSAKVLWPGLKKWYSKEYDREYSYGRFFNK